MSESTSIRRGDPAWSPAEAHTSADFDRAMDAIRDEMAKTRSDSVRALGEIITAMLQASPQIGGAILKKDKTLAGCWKEMEKYAREHKTGNSFCMGPDVAQNIIVEYYGMSLPTKVWETEYAKGVVKAGEGTEDEGTSSVSPAASHLTQRGKAFGEAATEPAAEAADMVVTATVTSEPDPFDLDALMGGI